MDRLACVELPALPLQMLRRAHPEWSGVPLAVVERDVPHAPVVCADERAARAGILPGTSYAAALARCAALRAGVVPQREVAAEVARLTELLQRSSPHVEPARAEAGIFWLDASGLTRLFGSLVSWGEALVEELDERGYTARVAIGFRRFASYAAVKGLSVARALRRPARVLVLRDGEQERELALALPLACLSIPPRARDELFLLDVRDLRALVELDEHGLAARFGPEVRALHRLASRELAPELDPVLERVPISSRVDFDLPEGELEVLLGHVARLAHALECRTTRAGSEPEHRVSALRVRFDVEGAHQHVERVAPPAGGVVGRSTGDIVAGATGDIVAAATSGVAAASNGAVAARARTEEHAPTDEGDAPAELVESESTRTPLTPELAWLLRLLRMRVSNLRFELGVRGLEVELELVRRAPRTGELFELARRRDPRHAQRAFDALRALFGPDAVVRAKLASAHLPEARFAWEVLPAFERPAFEHPAPERTRREARPHLVRRILERPRPWKQGEELLARACGPYRISGGWWGCDHRAIDMQAARGRDDVEGVERDYYFVETRSGELAWIFHDKKRGAWFLHGWVG